ncbi:transmembrane and coiled-coil domains protein 2-like [Toxorhynchites rutilus septentrionalis]|uniref:transmembrane and coiled-coil domains protein 2-like n=1 Tax=Toxorhynchites rutilus septentrionalis TaxID=329112 RepID=UPI00247A0DD3|nr:transmembrane and coiled-coil domains protein 2-like [Toxorhynchites rutilus septentrionalis]
MEPPYPSNLELYSDLFFSKLSGDCIQKSLDDISQNSAIRNDVPSQQTGSKQKNSDTGNTLSSNESTSVVDELKDDEDTCLQSQFEENEGNLTIISQLSNDSTDVKLSCKGLYRTSSSLAYNRITTKIACTKESIKKEQTARDANVNEYLKLAASADKQQLQRIKAVFEKKNQKSAHNISQLQKKLESYSKRYKDLQFHYSQKQQNQRQPREMLRDVGQGLRNVGGNIRDGVTGLSATVMSKPREFAHLIKNKFGSADNINQLTSTNQVWNCPEDSSGSAKGVEHGEGIGRHPKVGHP